MKLFVDRVDSIYKVFELPCNEISLYTEARWRGKCTSRQTNCRHFGRCADFTRVKDECLGRFTSENEHTVGTDLNASCRLGIDEVMIVDGDLSPTLIGNRLAVVAMCLLNLRE